MALSLAAPVVSVTVYPGQARVTRRGSVDVPAGGPVDVVVGDLPPGLVRESVRVGGYGPGAVAGVDVRTAHRADDGGRAAALRAEQRALGVAAQELADRRRVLDVRATLVESVAADAGRPYARRLAAGLAPDDLAPVGERLAAQLADVLAEQRALLADESRLADEQARVERELSALGRSGPDRTEIVVAVEPGAGGTVELEVSYLVDGATWEPRYDVRLAGGEVEITWFGMVSQHSGEDWPACELRLSTARPAAAVTIGDLEPWYLSERQLARTRGLALAMEAMDAVVAGAPVAAASAAASPLATLDAAVEEGVTAATYVVRRPVAVPSDGSAHRALVTSFRVPAALDHVTAPVRSDDVYLRATVTNTSPHTLRTGQAALFHETEFVGATELDVLAPGEEVELALGLDDRVRVRRELVARRVDKAFLGGAARHEARWRTTVANHTGRPATVTVLDQAPVALAGSIRVLDVTTTPEATVDDVGQVTWRVELAEGEQVDLELAVRVEVAKGTTMVGWRE